MKPAGGNGLHRNLSAAEIEVLAHRLGQYEYTLCLFRSRNAEQIFRQNWHDPKFGPQSLPEAIKVMEMLEETLRDEIYSRNGGKR